MTVAMHRRRPFLRPRALIAVGLVSLVAGVAGLSREIGFLSRVRSVEAEVVAVESLGSEEILPLYRATLRFSPTAGETVERAAAESYRPTSVGERLEAGFDPESIDDIRLMDIRDRWLSPVWMLLFGVLTLAIAVHRWRNPAPEQPADAS
jgi:hypothetical protein